MPSGHIENRGGMILSIEGFNLLRKRGRGQVGPYQLIIDNIDLFDMETACEQLKIIAKLLSEGSDQLDKAIVLMPPGTHLARVR